MVRVNPPLVSSLLVPVTALAVALGPAVAPPPAIPVMQVDEIQLAGIGQDIYNAITPVVQTVVGDVSYLINFIPLVGGIAAAQININYFQGIQPTVAATVNYAAALLHAPLDFLPITRAYVDTLVGIGYDLLSAELRFLGFDELPPRPAGTRTPSPRVAASAAPGDTPVPVAVAEQAAVTVVPARNPRKVRSPERLRPKAAAAKAASSAKDQAETRRQKPTTGRTRSAIADPTSA